MKAVGYQKSLPIEDPQALFDFEAEKPEPKGHDIRVAVKAGLHTVGVKEDATYLWRASRTLRRAIQLMEGDRLERSRSAITRLGAGAG